MHEPINAAQDVSKSTFGPDDSLLWEAVLCLVGHVASWLALAGSTLPAVRTTPSPDTAKCPLGAEPPSVPDHWFV